MPTLDEITTNVQRWVGNHSLASSTFVNALVNEEYRSLGKTFFFDEDEFEEEIDTTDGNTEIVLTTDDWWVVNSVHDADNRQNLQVKDEAWWERQDDFETEGIPLYFVQRLGSLHLYPIPDDEYSLIVRGRKLPAALTSGQSPVYAEEWHYVIECKAAYRMANVVGLAEIMMRAQNAALSRISEITENRTARRRMGSGQISIERRRGMDY